MAEASSLSEKATLSLEKCVQAVIDCDLCEETTDVLWRCDTCSAKLCAKCKAIHESRTVFKHHRIITRQGNNRHLKDFQMECESMVEIHHIGSKAMLEYKKNSKWFISTIDEDGNLKNARKFSFRTHGFTISPTEAIYVCDIDGHMIWSVLPDGSMKKKISTSPDQPWGVCLNYEGNIVACLKSSIAVFSKDTGKKLKSIRNINEKGNEIFCWAYKIFQDKRKQYRLLDWGSDRNDRYVLGFDKDFKLKWSYTSEQEESIYSPISICGDPFQNVVVGFYSATVELLDSSGHFLMLFKTSKELCSYPQQVSVAENNVLWVVNEYNRTISLFQYMQR